MNKTTCLIILFLIGYIAIVNAEVSKEDPYFGIGSEFLVVGTGNPEIFTLFDNTNIYLDNNNDGIWDYQFQGNSGEIQILNPPWPINRGARIQTNKPVMYKQLTYENICRWDPCDTFYYTTVPPLNNLESEYYVFSLGDNWQVVAPQVTTINFDIDIDGTIDQTLSVDRGKINSSQIPYKKFARIYSESGKKFSLYGRYALAAPVGSDFYTNLGSIKVLVSEDNTKVNIDMNNDLAYDETYTLNKGAHDISTIQGAHINSNKPIAVYSNFQGTFFPIATSGMINNDLWGESGNLYRIIGLFNNASGLYYNTTYNIDFQAQNDLISNFTGQIAANVIANLPSMGNVHLWADMPLNYLFYQTGSGRTGHPKFLPSYSYSRIYPVTFSEEKYIGSEDDLIINARVFNPFAETTATSFSVKLRFNDLFAFPAIFTVEINKKNLNTDAVISSDTITKIPVLINGQYEFVIDSSESSLLNSLGPFEYYEIRYNLISPLVHGFYDFEPVEITYNAPTWETPI
jgi:hypothetical protein